MAIAITTHQAAPLHPLFRASEISRLRHLPIQAMPTFRVVPEIVNSYSAILSNLRSWIYVKVERFSSTSDLDFAIQTLEAAVDDTPNDDDNLADRLSNLGNAFGMRFPKKTFPKPSSF